MNAPRRLLTLEVRLEHDVVLCRQRARELAAAFGFDLQGQTRVATAVSEIARNAFEYAGGGKVEFAVETARRPVGRSREAGQSLVITVRDQGPGFPSAGGGSPSRGLGLGLAGARRLMDDLQIASAPGATAVVLRKTFPPAAPVLSPPQLQAVVDRIAAQPAAHPLAELQLQNQELIHALDEVRARQEDLAHVNQELADTNAGVLALYDELETLHRVSTLLASKLDLHTLLQSIIDATTELTNAEFGAFFYLDETGGGWRLHATAGPARAALADLPASFDADFFGPGFAAEGVMRIPELGLHAGACGASKFARALDGKFSLQSCLTIPVASESATLGAMVFGSSATGTFTERSERIITSIAAQAVVGIEKARLFAEVRSASAAKDRFLAMLSHELRTPLNPVLALISSLADDPRLPAEVQQDLGVALRNVRLEARLIDDLLDFNRIINGKLQLHREPLDLHALIRGVAAICAGDLAGGSHSLTLHLAAPRSLVSGDSARLQQMLWNVLKNAIKFTPTPGRITVRTGVEDLDTLVVTITDTGVGIEAAALGQIFGAFEQGGVPVTAKFGGLGIGLAIAKAFVELHRGTIHALSAGAGEGTQIVIRLPLLPEPALPEALPAGASAAPANAPAGGAAATILLVDDHADTLHLMARLLTRRGHRVLTAGSCQTALEVARTQRFDLIVSDLGLPDGSGLQLLPELRRHRPVPAIALSGYGMEEDVLQSRAAGYEEHLTKPTDFAVLMRTIDKLLPG